MILLHSHLSLYVSLHYRFKLALIVLVKLLTTTNNELIFTICCYSFVVSVTAML